jgi:hypothetical protein
MDLAEVSGQNWRQPKKLLAGQGDVMPWGRAVAFIVYGAVAVALASGGLACEATSHTSGAGPPVPTGAEATPPPARLASVTSIAPRAAAGGSQVTINGTGFTFAKAVCFGTASSPDYRVNDSGTRITAVVPTGSGTVPVAVITAVGASVVRPDDRFTYPGSAVASGATSSALPVSPCASMSAETSP